MTDNNTIDIKAYTSVKNKKKRQKSEDFIGWKSPDGKLEVIGISGYQKTSALFKVTCTECSEDLELFPASYFISTKGDLLRGRKPCSCSKTPKWKDWQYLILARRASEGRFIVHDFSEEFKGVHTRLSLECLKDGHKWTASISSVINGDRGCPKCRDMNLAEQNKTPNHIALQRCVDICKETGYDVVGFVNGYKNNKSRFEYICKIHGKQNVSYVKFVTCGTRCVGCRKDLGNGNGYFPERKDEKDYLYILNFNEKFIKVGRSFDVKIRISQLKRQAKIKNIKKLYVLTGTHKEIYNLEQELHNELRERGFSYSVDWSTECFDNDSLGILNKLLDSCDLERVK